jgi:glucosamine--fructose-6-phosphate aminotransferase (isomerizing)
LLAVAFTFIGRMLVIGRGFEYATAREVALKLTETCRVAAEALTATDLSHGPASVARAREAGALVVATGSAARELDGSGHVLETPKAPLPILAPILSVLPGQLFASALARAKGLDPDEPEHLSKVTAVP